MKYFSTYVAIGQKMLLGPMSDEHSFAASHMFLRWHLSLLVKNDFKYGLDMTRPAIAASLTESLRPIDRAASDL